MIAPAVKFEIRKSEIDALNREINRWAAVTDQTIKEAVRAEAVPMVRDLVNLTPPRTAGHSQKFNTVAPQSQRKQGFQAIENDINRMFQPLTALEAIYNPHTGKFAKQIAMLLRAKAYKELGDILYSAEITTYRPKIIEEADPALHKKWRVASTGRVSAAIKNPWLVVNVASIEKLKSKLKKNVGYAKSGWWKSLRGLGMNVPAWIDKGGPGSYQPEQSRNHIYSLTVGNEVPYIQRKTDSIVGEAIRRRTESLFKRVEHMLSGKLKS